MTVHQHSLTIPNVFLFWHNSKQGKYMTLCSIQMAIPISILIPIPIFVLFCSILWKQSNMVSIKAWELNLSVEMTIFKALVYTRDRNRWLFEYKEPEFSCFHSF